MLLKSREIHRSDIESLRGSRLCLIKSPQQNFSNELHTTLTPKVDQKIEKKQNPDKRDYEQRKLIITGSKY